MQRLRGTERPLRPEQTRTPRRLAPGDRSVHRDAEKGAAICDRNADVTGSSDSRGDSPQRLVAQGYDAISEGYLSRFGASLVRAHWLRRLVDLTRADDRILDLGCGPGVPVFSTLLDHGRQVVGVDGSRR